MRLLHALVAGVMLAALGSAQAAEITVDVRLLTTDGNVGLSIGTLLIEETARGVRITPDLVGLPPGKHGIHVHENPSCEAGEKDGRVVPGLAAGEHFDPAHTHMHQGPDGRGHLGDLTVLTVKPDGTATSPILARRLRLAQIHGRSIVIHAGGDNYSDIPKPNGGGGDRIACAVVQ